jgi:undecaprenyl-diphosphatase
MTQVWARFVNRFDLAVAALLAWDEETLEVITTHPFLRKLEKVFLVATYLGDGYLWAALAVGLAAFGRSADRGYILMAMCVTTANIVIFRLFKALYARPRPLLIIRGPRARLVDHHSFPSGHATTAFGIASVIATVYPALWIQVLAYLIAITIGLSRVYLKEHYPLDVLCGAALGSGTAACLLPLFVRILF